MRHMAYGERDEEAEFGNLRETSGDSEESDDGGAITAEPEEEKEDYE